MELAEEDVPGDDALDHVGSVEAVHAVGSDGSFLGGFEDVVLFAFVQALGELVAVELLGDAVDEFGEVVPLHLSALVVEVEPNVGGVVGRLGGSVLL